MSDVPGQADALKHIRTAFEKGTNVPEQVQAIMTLVVPNNEHFAIKVLDAGGVTEYPESKAEKIDAASKLLQNFMLSGSAPKGVIDYAVDDMGRMMTAAHRHKINNAFKL